MHQKYYMVLMVSLLLPVLAGAMANAQPANNDCMQQLKETQDELQHAQSQFSICRSAKVGELENFNAKRARYLRLIAWASNLEFADSLKPYIEALNERDLLLTSKADEFEACVPPLREITVAMNTPEDGASCDRSLADSKSDLGNLGNDLKACQACSLGLIGAGYNKSATEILIQQQKFARELRHALYLQLSSDNIEINTSVNPWLVTRDVFLAYITDTAVTLPNTQGLIVMLERLEQQLESVNSANEFTDQVMEVYRQLGKTLQSKPRNRNQQAERLLQLFSAVVPDYRTATSRARYTGFSDAVEIAQRFDAMPPQARDTLNSVISTALQKYKPDSQ